MAETNDPAAALAEIHQMQQAQAELEVRLAGLDERVHDAVIDGLADVDASDASAFADGAHDLVAHEQAAHDHRLAAEALDEVRAEAVDRGDFDAAREASEHAEYHLEEAASLTHEATPDLVEAQQETAAESAALGWADYHDEIADANADTAASYLAEGDADHAAQYGESAANAYDASADYADAGGGGADALPATTYDTSTAYDTTTTSYDATDASYDTTAE